MEALAGAPLASFGKRALAFVIDFAVAAVSFVVFFFYILFPYLPRWMVILGFWRPGRHNIDFSFHEWPSLVFLTLYFGLSTYWSNGRTPGKWLCGIRVVSLTHRRITLWTAIERALGYGASVLELGSGFLQYFVAPRRSSSRCGGRSGRRGPPPRRWRSAPSILIVEGASAAADAAQTAGATAVGVRVAVLDEAAAAPAVPLVDDGAGHELRPRDGRGESRRLAEGFGARRQQIQGRSARGLLSRDGGLGGGGVSRRGEGGRDGHQSEDGEGQKDLSTHLDLLSGTRGCALLLEGVPAVGRIGTGLNSRP
jgi:uncharacterized RDD family membrane protein YckC